MTSSRKPFTKVLPRLTRDSLENSQKSSRKTSPNLKSSTTAGIYIHFPFCKSRCSYCDFVTQIYLNNNHVENYIEALCLEIENFHVPETIKIDTIYLGGGTPSLLEPKQLSKILETINRNFSLNNEIEFTIEINPSTESSEKFYSFRKLGINRASIGIQTFDNRLLKMLGRQHTAEDAINTYKILRKVGFQNISFDLIAGLPYQTLEDWKQSVEKAVELGPEHLSLYLLEIHENTPLAQQIRDGRRPMPDEDLAAAMYNFMIDKLESCGYLHYEISNFARSLFESKHNMKYWLCQPVFGFGVSAASFYKDTRWQNEKNITKYMELVKSGKSARTFQEKINLASEIIFLTLRLKMGLNLKDYKTKFGLDLQERFSKDLEKLKELQLIEIEDNYLRLTRKGFLYSNEVFATFI
jgi:oxygen-independent coproporphyrinogen-3 oxidase